MHILDTNYSEEILHLEHLDFGKLFVIDSFVVVEIDEGINLDFEKLLTLFNSITIYCEHIPYNLVIFNRLFEYSIDLNSLVKVYEVLKKPTKTVHVRYCNVGKLQSEFEQKFMRKEIQIVDSLAQAFDFLSEKQKTA